METALGLTALSTTLSLIALWALFHWLYRDYRVDLFRQRMFALRDQLFDIAASGRIAFDDPAYGKLRGMTLAEQLEKQLEQAELRVRKLQPSASELAEAEADFAEEMEESE